MSEQKMIRQLNSHSTRMENIATLSLNKVPLLQCILCLHTQTSNCINSTFNPYDVAFCLLFKTIF